MIVPPITVQLPINPVAVVIPIMMVWRSQLLVMVSVCMYIVCTYMFVYTYLGDLTGVYIHTYVVMISLWVSTNLRHYINTLLVLYDYMDTILVCSLKYRLQCMYIQSKIFQKLCMFCFELFLSNSLQTAVLFNICMHNVCIEETCSVFICNW